MRILMISCDPTILAGGDSVPGDTRLRHIKYAQHLRKRFPQGHISVIVRVPRGSVKSSKPKEIAEGLTVYPVPCRRAEFPLHARSVIQSLLQQDPYDITTTQTPFDDGWLGVWTKKKFGNPLNVQMRSSFLDVPYWIRQRPLVYRAFNALGKWVSHQADTIRVISLGEKKRLEKLFPRWRSKILVLHPLVNYQVFSQPLQEEETRIIRSILQRRNLEDVPFFLFVGRLVFEKNLPTLLRAFALLPCRSQQAALVIAGTGPLSHRLKKLAHNLRVEDRILWLGNVPLKDLRGWYASATATVLPSLYEGFGKVIVESYLMGTPVIVTPFTSALELVQHGVTGFITRSFSNPEELADNMEKLLESPRLAKQMGKSGKMHMRRYLLPEEDYMKQLIDIWVRTAAAGRSR